MYWRIAAVLLITVSLLGTGYGTVAESTGQNVAVILFHEVASDIPGNSAVISPEEFERTIATLKREGYNFISLDTFHAFMERRGTVPPRAILVTFDDGYEGVYKYAHNALVKHRVPAVMFAVMKWFSPHARPESSRPHLTGDQASEMLSSGLWDFGGHSYDGHWEIPISPEEQGKFLSHRAWIGDRQENEDEYKARIWSDIMLMTQGLRRFDVEPSDFAAPYGAVSPVLQDLLREAGYKYLYVQENRLNSPGETVIHRVTVTNTDQVLSDLQALFGE